jgi:hypothetical protein
VSDAGRLRRESASSLIDRFSGDLDDKTLERRPFDVAWVRSYFTEDAEPPDSVDYARLARHGGPAWVGSLSALASCERELIPSLR